MAKLTVECIGETFVQTLEVAGKKYVNTYVPFRYGHKIREQAFEEQFGLDYPDAADGLLDKIENIGFPDEIREALEALSEMEAEEPESNMDKEVTICKSESCPPSAAGGCLTN